MKTNEEKALIKTGILGQPPKSTGSYVSRDAGGSSLKTHFFEALTKLLEMQVIT